MQIINQIKENGDMETIKYLLLIINISISLIGLIASIILIEKLPYTIFILIPLIGIMFYYNFKSNSRRN